MWKWLRSWFAWRFSLGRLVVATVFLGAVVGLNVRDVRPTDDVSYCSGWPIPFAYRWHQFEHDPARDGLTVVRLPDQEFMLFPAILDALFIFTALAFILFLQVPRRKEPSPSPPVRAGG
jgi:hypothetical protein